MTLQEHVIKGSYDFMEEPFKISHHPAKFGCYRDSYKRDIRISVCHVILQDQLIKAFYDFMFGRLSKFITILSNFVVIGTMIVIDKGFSLSRGLTRSRD